MWNWFNCYLSGRHDYGMWCERGTIFLRCTYCGTRSSGWAIESKAQNQAVAPSAKLITTKAAARVVPFKAAAAR